MANTISTPNGAFTFDNPNGEHRVDVENGTLTIRDQDGGLLTALAPSAWLGFECGLLKITAVPDYVFAKAPEKVAPPAYDEDVEATIRATPVDRRRLMGVKHYRDKYQASLKDACEAVDGMITTINKEVQP